MSNTMDIIQGRHQLKYCLFSPRKLGKMIPFWRAYFSDRLKPPIYIYTQYPPCILIFIVSWKNVWFGDEATFLFGSNLLLGSGRLKIICQLLEIRKPWSAWTVLLETIDGLRVKSWQKLSFAQRVSILDSPPANHVTIGGGNSFTFFMFTPILEEMHPIWRLHIFQMGASTTS